MRMLSVILSFIGTSLLILGFYGCQTNKGDVAEEVREMRKERAEANSAALELATGEKESYVSNVKKRMDQFDVKLGQLRAEAIQATGMRKKELQDRIWSLDRQISEARQELKSLERKSAKSWDDERENLNEKLSLIDSGFDAKTVH